MLQGIVQCKICRVSVPYKRTNDKRAKFCSYECYFRYRKEQAKKKMTHFCGFCGVRINKNRKYCTKACTFADEKYRKKMKRSTTGKNNGFYGRHHTEETKRKISLKKIGVTPTYTEESRKRRMIKYKLTRQRNKRLGLAKPTWTKGLTKETDERIRKLGLKISETRSKTISAGHWHPKSIWYKHGFIKNKQGRKERYSSSYEKLVMLYLNRCTNVTTWTMKHGISIPYEFNGHIRHYVPDFMIKTKDEVYILEVKNKYTINLYETKQKLKALRSYCQMKNYKDVVWFERNTFIKEIEKQEIWHPQDVFVGLLG